MQFTEKFYEKMKSRKKNLATPWKKKRKKPTYAFVKGKVQLVRRCRGLTATSVDILASYLDGGENPKSENVWPVTSFI